MSKNKIVNEKVKGFYVDIESFSGSLNDARILIDKIEKYCVDNNYIKDSIIIDVESHYENTDINVFANRYETGVEKERRLKRERKEREKKKKMVNDKKEKELEYLEKLAKKFGKKLV